MSVKRGCDLVLDPIADDCRSVSSRLEEQFGIEVGEPFA